MKRLRSEEGSGKKVFDLIEKKCCGKEFSFEDAINFTKSQKNLHGCDGAEDLTSVWGTELAEAAGGAACGWGSFEFVLFRHCPYLSRHYGWDRESVEKAAEKEKLNNECAKLKKDKSDLEGRVVDLCIEKKEFEEEKRKYGFNMFAVAWDRVKAQAEFFTPRVNFEDMDPVKVVHKGSW
ncbi:hypothetical protein PIB30_026493 [Stylosanthes scabra]|uniref:Uncharacterized protein n=1 Tax=Stylosanthes scabra TaxID=79078 RepID=A0ABU6XBB0_9FABA|nr:hypothetical protein [Stylosanthes scabra]